MAYTWTTLRHRSETKLNPNSTPRSLEPQSITKVRRWLNPLTSSLSLHSSQQRCSKKSMRFLSISRRMIPSRRSHTLKLLPNLRVPMPR